MNCITTSLFDIFRIGPGPSSSHTIGPMRAAHDFMKQVKALPMEGVPENSRISVHFHGSLAMTGKGHGSDRAVAAGLLGEVPESCDTKLLTDLLTAPCEVDAGNGRVISVTVADFHFHMEDHDFPCQNTVVLELRAPEGDLLLSDTYFSIGGGFIRKMGDPEEIPGSRSIPNRYRNMDTFHKMLDKTGLTYCQALIQNELSLHPEMTEEMIRSELKLRIEVMCQAVERGLRKAGILPGPLGIQRRAAQIYRQAEKLKPEESGKTILLLDAFAMAASEENAAGTLIVTAPTSGSSGVIPATVYYMRKYNHVSTDELVNAMLVAGCVGMIARFNASISGAEVGCQGEIGVASAMAAALRAAVDGQQMEEIECAAEIALEHHLGMTCDPVAGYVQVPCIERNAMGTVTAYNAYLLARTGASQSCKVRFDEAVEAMHITGKCMAAELKETSRGGLAVSTICM